MGRDYKFKTTNIKGKEYVEVNERIKFFRTDERFAGWSLESDIIEHTGGAVIIKSVIRNPNRDVVATGLAREKEGDGFINKTSYIENCETSSWGRALANLGIGVDTSIASSDEVNNAILQQSSQPKGADDRKIITRPIFESMVTAIDEGKSEAVKARLSGYKDSDLKSEILKIIG